MRPIYERRAAFVSSNPDVQAEFWRRVFAAAPGHIDSYVLPSDAQIIGQSLRYLTVERFEVNDKGEGDPRSVRFTFEFDPQENKWFDGNKIVKEFYWRKEVKKTKAGNRVSWEGLVSTPVRISWKEGMDPTRGLLDAACDLADEEEKARAGDSKLSVEKRKGLPAYEKLVEKVAKLEADEEGAEGDDGEDPMTVQSPAGMSFFAWFGYRGKDISIEESKAAEKNDEERFEKMTKGEDVDLSDDEDGEDEFFDDDGLEDAEVFPDGEELAAAISDDLYPNALKYYGKLFFHPSIYLCVLFGRFRKLTWDQNNRLRSRQTSARTLTLRTWRETMTTKRPVRELARKLVPPRKKTRALHLVRKLELEFDIPVTPFVVSYIVSFPVVQSTITKINRRIRTKMSTAMQQLDIVSSAAR